MLPRVNLVRTNDHDYLLFATPDIISTNINKYGSWGRHMNKVSRFICDHNETPLVIDVGANLGAYSIPLAKHLESKGGRVHSFEPQRIIYYQLCGNIFLNRLENIYAHNLGVGDVEEEIEIPRIDYSKTKNIGAFSLDEFPERKAGIKYDYEALKDKIMKIKLDDFKFNGLPALVKIDVEGLELQVLKGAVGLLENAKFPPIILEVWQEEWFKQQKEELLGFLKHLGYILAHNDNETLALHPSHPIQFKANDRDGKMNLERLR